MIGWFDGGAGASGDMALGALVGAGVPLDVIASGVEALGLGVELRTEAVERGGLAATRVHVEVPETTTMRHLADIVALFGPLDAEVAELAATVFEWLARAEAAVHATTIDEVHFHEVGALDSIADVVGAAAGIVHLGLERVTCSTLSLGSGRTRGAHGPIPVPAPAVLQLLAGVAPVQAGPASFESTTPTGAALLASIVDEWTTMPPMIVSTIGMGAGGRDSDEVANVLRLVVGEPPAAGAGVPSVQLETNVDDLDPRVWPSVITAAMEAGAVDAWVTPITMKKGRPAITFSALCDRVDAPAVRAAIFRETSTIGVRELAATKHPLERTASEIVIDGHRIAVKIARHGGAIVNRSVEWDDVVAAATSLGRPAKDVLDEANALAVEVWA